MVNYKKRIFFVMMCFGICFFSKLYFHRISVTGDRSITIDASDLQADAGDELISTCISPINQVDVDTRIGNTRGEVYVN